MNLPEPYREGINTNSDFEEIEDCGDELLRIREKYGEDTFQRALSAIEVHDSES